MRRDSRSLRRARRGAVACCVAALFVVTAQGADITDPGNGGTAAAARLPGYGPRVYGERPSVAEMTALGAQLFNDPGLSASGRLACASCHSPQHAFAPPNALPAQFGGPQLRSPGRRNAPSLMYLQTTIPFTEHYIDDEDGHGEDAGPTGGLTWDGRVNSAHEQARIPLFAAHEMANADAPALAARVRRAAYADDFRRAFSGPHADVFDDPEEVVNWLAGALEVYQQDAPTFYPFSSKYDAALRGQVQLDARELRGLALFEDPQKGNCASCHPSRRRADGGLPLFSDGGYAALGVPRNRQLAANRNPRHFDLGLCGPERQDLATHPEYCGLFKAPSLRNSAQRGSYFHNGQFHSLREVVAFYATRDSNTARWYPRRADGSPRRYDDLPARHQGNVNREPPFAPMPGLRPRLNPREIDDIVSFLRTLNDGYRP
jgi:cytochrome c peroxidase